MSDLPSSTASLPEFKHRLYGDEQAREGDVRGPYQRDRARIIHSAGFRRLQGKTQVMGVGEGDFHRTRLTHSIEAAQIGRGLVNTIRERADDSVKSYLPPASLIETACLAHDIGHPPFGHGGERALHAKMRTNGGFEGNGQTLRVLTRLEKYRAKHQGLNPTRRLILAILKYGLPYSRYAVVDGEEKPPKCYYDLEQDVIDFALQPFPKGDKDRFQSAQPVNGKPTPQYMTFDASIMELADDIAYAVHDLEDIVARRLITREDIENGLSRVFTDSPIIRVTHALTKDELIQGLFSKWSGDRKQVISRLVNLFIASVGVEPRPDFNHPLLRFHAKLPGDIEKFLKSLKAYTYELVVNKANVQQLEVRGQRIVSLLYDELIRQPDKLIPLASWEDLNSADDASRRVCDYIAGMTDGYAQKIYQRLFSPGFGSSHDEL